MLIYLPHIFSSESTMLSGALVYIHVTLLKYVFEQIWLPHFTYMCHCSAIEV